ncbi:unnamed protein product [Lepeophtheirus salmonis]|uniref:(salmon louse) hypothetical protein n=1 Tax=Lepeophtheirus salmonis TaxID=72036 RepID=A0A7R8D1D7_LEPSM|nr:unnamed protein product [Lepeophtheirus salmonis]CAF2967942.1 unnamed protein product [Lepeophtheirus salmonis]
MLLKIAFYSLVVLLALSETGSAINNLPIFQNSQGVPFDEEDIPMDRNTLPKELLDQLEDDEIIDDITVTIDNKQTSVNLRDDDSQEDAEEGLRRSDAAEEDRQGFFNNGFSKEQLLKILGNTQDLEKALPINRGIVKQRVTNGDIDDLTRNIILDEKKLPGVLTEDGKRCVEKVILVEETEYERGMKCHHTFKKKCHLTYITDYDSASEKKCDTSFKKNCHITFKPVPHTEKVKKCRTPLIKECGDEIKGPEVCTTQYENHCETQYKTYELEQDEPNCRMVEELRCKNETIALLHIGGDSSSQPFGVRERCEKWPVQKCELEKKKKVTKVHPKTECTKVPKKVCTPSNCKTKPGEEICYEESRTHIQNVPDEECGLQPEENCRMEASLVPRLVPKNNCIKVPKEVCVTTKKNPKKVSKPIVKNCPLDNPVNNKDHVDELMYILISSSDATEDKLQKAVKAD